MWSIVEQALEVEGVSRQELLVELCGEDQELFARVLGLLRQEGRAEQIEPLTRPPSEVLSAQTQVGRWRLIRELGRGGMGSVWLVERVGGEFRQLGALKVMERRGDEAQRRFEAEMRVLGELQHENIAAILDAGTLGDERPYFVMEYVEGQPLDECWQSMGLKDRVRLLIEVGKAVAMAHRQLIVHRDLKPSNILVTAEGRVKLLDFGIAKALPGSDVPVQSTGAGIFLLTPAYAAPEQVSGELVTVATDIYTLGGVLLVEACGGRPYMEGVYEDGGAAVMRAVVESDFMLPSEAARRWEGGLRNVPVDLDAIAGKCLRREREERYRSVEELLVDLEDFVVGLPVRAIKRDFGYWARRMTRHYWRAIALTVAILTILIGSLGNYVSQAKAVRRSNMRAQVALDTLVELFAGADPRTSPGQKVTVEEVLAKSAEKVRDELDNQPEMKATLMTAMGRIYTSIGDMGEAQSLLLESLEIRKRVLGDSHRDVAITHYHLGEAFRIHWRFKEAEKYYRAADASGKLEGLAAARVQRGLGRVLARDVERTQEARELLRSALGVFKREGSGYEDWLSCRKGLALAAIGEGNYEEAESVFRALLVDLEFLGDNHPEVADIQVNWAITMHKVGKSVEALEVLESAENVLRSSYGEKSIHVVNAQAERGHILLALGRRDEAEEAYREVVKIRGVASGQDGNVVSSLQSLGRILSERGEFEEAEQLMLEAVRLSREGFSESSEVLEISLDALAVLYLRSGQYEEAVAAYEDSARVIVLREGEGSRKLGFPWLGLGRVARARGDCKGAVAWFDRAEERFVEGYGEGFVWLGMVWIRWGECLREMGDEQSALERFERALKVYRENGVSEGVDMIVDLRGYIRELGGSVE